eukprot:5602858-Amphidinium_carterae.2
MQNGGTNQSCHNCVTALESNQLTIELPKSGLSLTLNTRHTGHLDKTNGNAPRMSSASKHMRMADRPSVGMRMNSGLSPAAWML